MTTKLIAPKRGAGFKTVKLVKVYFLLFVSVSSLVIGANDRSYENCKRITDDMDRLSCYDNLYKAANENNLKTQKTIQTQSRQASPQENFGLKEKRDSEAQQGVRAAIKSISLLNNGRVSISLDNGQTWRSNDDPGRLRLKPLTKVTITESRIGGFVLKAEGQKGFVRVKRVK